MIQNENIPSKSHSGKEGIKVSIISIIINISLSILKFVAGILGHSSAMVSDAVHSASDVFSSILVIIGMKISHKDADIDHPYGHDRFEAIASIVLAFMLLGAGIAIGYSGINKVISSSYYDLPAPDLLALLAAITSIAVKEWMYHYTIKTADKINSPSLRADAWHHRSDALSSVGALIGIGGAMLGVPVLDPIASIVICIFISKAAIEIFLDSSNRLVDRACDKQTIKQMLDIIYSQKGILSVDLLDTRIFGSKIYVDTEISVNGNMSLTEAHIIAEEVHDAIESYFPNVKHCMVHVNPKNELE